MVNTYILTKNESEEHTEKYMSSHMTLTGAQKAAKKDIKQEIRWNKQKGAGWWFGFIEGQKLAQYTILFEEVQR